MSKPVTLINLFAFILVLPFVPSVTMTDTALFAKNSAQFAIELYNLLSGEEGANNLIFSPFSIQTCVALAYAGAEGETAQQMANGLHLVANDPKAVGESFKSVLDAYKNSTLLKVANKIYVKKGYSIKPEFNEIAEKSFHSSSEEIDFTASKAAAKTINKWVEERTNDKIKDLIKPSYLDNLTRLVLVNAIHFKGEWEKKFEKDATRKEDFYLNENDTVKVDMMNGKAKYNFGYFDDLKCTALEMPYRDSDLSMLVLLPDSRTGLKELEKKLQDVNLLDLTQRMSVEEVIVKFPKFKVEYSVDLNIPLEKLGMTRMFSDHAEFDNLLVSPEPLQVSKVVHKAFIEVNEEGAEAAAATAILVSYITSLGSIEFPREFSADRPFTYFIKDSNNVVLFSGRNIQF